MASLFFLKKMHQVIYLIFRVFLGGVFLFYLKYSVYQAPFNPDFTLGKFKRKESQIVMPMAIQVHHAVCDGYHVGMFVQKLQGFANNVDSRML